MKLSPMMVQLFLRSAGAPPSVLKAADLMMTQEFESFGYQPMCADDPGFTRVGMLGEDRKGIWLQALGKESRVVLAVFCEGMDESFLEQMQTLLPATAGAAVPLLQDSGSATGRDSER